MNPHTAELLANEGWTIVSVPFPVNLAEHSQWFLDHPDCQHCGLELGSNSTSIVREVFAFKNAIDATEFLLRIR
jgi:hypothetical protein